MTSDDSATTDKLETRRSKLPPLPYNERPRLLNPYVPADEIEQPSDARISSPVKVADPCAP